MKRNWIWSLGILALWTMAQAQSSRPESGLWGVLQLDNGDHLEVCLEAYNAADGVLIAVHPLAKTPVEIREAALYSFSVPDPGSPPATQVDGWMLEMAGGDMLYAEALSADEQNFTIVHHAMGRITLPRASTRLLNRQAAVRTYYQGPATGEEWKFGGQAKILTAPDLRILAGQTVGRQLPDMQRRSRIDLHIKFWSIPFSIFLFAKENERNMWEAYQLLVQSNQQLSFLRGSQSRGMSQIGIKQLSEFLGNWLDAKWTFFTDLDARRIWLYVNDQMIANWEDPRDYKDSGRGLYFQATGGGMTIKKIRISHWDGRLPDKLASRSAGNSDVVHLLNGDTVSGTLFRLNEQGVGMRTPFGELFIPLRDVDHVVFKQEKPDAVPTPKGVRVLLDDGSRLTMKLLRIAEGVLYGEVIPWGAVRVPLSSLREALWKQSTFEREGENSQQNRPGGGNTTQNSAVLSTTE